MVFNKEKLLDLLRELDKNIHVPVKIILIGGSAVNYLDLKESTKDVDFFYDGMNYEEMSEITDKVSKKYDNVRIDIWDSKEMVLNKRGRIVTQKLPDDYISRCTDIGETYDNIQVKILNPVDIILTKIERLNSSDIDDIKHLVGHFGIGKQELKERYQDYLKDEEWDNTTFRSNFKSMLEILYD